MLKSLLMDNGRIGRNTLRALYESGRTDEIQVVAVNDLGDADTNAHLTKYDTVHGRFPGTVSVEGGNLVLDRSLLQPSGRKSIRTRSRGSVFRRAPTDRVSTP